MDTIRSRTRRSKDSIFTLAFAVGPSSKYELHEHVRFRQKPPFEPFAESGVKSQAKPLSSTTQWRTRCKRGVDITVIALWLGHEGHRYDAHLSRGGLATKEEALSGLQPIDAPAPRGRAPDHLMASLQSL